LFLGVYRMVLWMLIINARWKIIFRNLYPGLWKNS